MSAVMEIVEDSKEFFAPVSSDVIDMLLGQYQAMRGRIDKISCLLDAEMSEAVEYFLDGNKDQNRGSLPSVKQLFDPKGAIASLNSAYWSRAMGLTDVYDCMPQARRDEWSKSIREMTAPEFTEDAVRPTISDLLASRAKFFGERVDGIFRGLSGEHVTNSPAAFSKRMIIGYVTQGYHYTSNSKAGLINDLRAVIAKFMGRDEPKWNSSGAMINAAYLKHGQWITVDGGALRIRCYLKGTAHLEVHPDIAWKLNQVLAGMYPAAIPAEFRTQPKKKSKEFKMMQRPLPFAVVDVLSQMKQATRIIKQEDNYRHPHRRESVKDALAFDHYGALDKHVLAEVRNVLVSIGGVLSEEGWYQFDYAPAEIIAEVVCSGCIPDQKAHQFYPTPENVAVDAVEMANIGVDHTILEPSAGQGDLAALLPKELTTCVEISALHCSILKARGFNTVNADFIKWAESKPKFHRVVMNPPFSEGRAQAHVQTASELVREGGRLVAILPASFKGKSILTGWNVTWSRIYENEFAGTSVSVVIMCGDKP